MVSVLHHSLTQQACQLWLMWNQHIRPLITLSQRPAGINEEEATDDAQLMRWDEMVKMSMKAWERLVGQNSVAAAEEGDVLWQVPEGLEADQVDEVSRFSDGASSSSRV